MESSRTESPAPETPTSYRWESPSKRVVVELGFDVVDQLNYDVMKGFGAVPRRGAEVGGLLLGTVEYGEPATIRITDCASVPCQHARGPSFILSDTDLAQFDEIVGRSSLRVVGMYRSNTREFFELTPEDATLMENHIPGGGAVALLIKPFATRIAEAVFLVREDGRVENTSAEPFPFRRKEMGGGASKPPRTAPANPDPVRAAPRVEQRVEPPPHQALPLDPAAMAIDEEAPPMGAPSFGYAEPDLPYRPSSLAELPEEPVDEEQSRFRGGWIWIPLSFIFLLLGVVLGFQIAISFRSGRPMNLQNDPYSMDLAATKFGESLQLKWNLESMAVIQAQRGVLTIHDGPSAKIVELNREDLARGSVLYRNLSSAVRFRLEVFPRERNSVVETIDVQVAGSAAEGTDGSKQEATKARRE